MSFIQLDNLNDFIHPATACTKPPVDPNKVGRVTKIKDISLSDCLACSGCITSAEKVLVDQQHSDKLFEIIRQNSRSERKRVIVASLSLQAIASIAHKNLLPIQDTAERLCTFLKATGVDKVYEINLARHLSLIETHREFLERKSKFHKLPILSSICPGWICYVEKTNGELIIPFLSRVRSPQQIMGAILKNHILKKEGLSANDIYHLTVMPCFDKKLEASRPDFKNELIDSSEVDLVLTPVELENMLEQEGVRLEELVRSPLDLLVKTDSSLDSPLSSHLGSESGGYAENIMVAELVKLYPNQDAKSIANSIKRTISRNNDFIELSYGVDKNQQDEIEKHIGKFAIVNGFRNLQTVVQRLKRKALKYDYIEVMACPTGCINGGAQSHPDTILNQNENIDTMKGIYNQVTPVEMSIDSESDQVDCLYQRLQINEESIRNDLLYTGYHEIPKQESLNVNW